MRPLPWEPNSGLSTSRSPLALSRTSAVRALASCSETQVAGVASPARRSSIEVMDLSTLRSIPRALL